MRKRMFDTRTGVELRYFASIDGPANSNGEGGGPYYFLAHVKEVMDAGFASEPPVPPRAWNLKPKQLRLLRDVFREQRRMARVQRKRLKPIKKGRW